MQETAKPVSPKRPEELVEILNRWYRNDPTLTAIDFSGRNLDDVAAEMFARYLRENYSSALTYLNLAYNDISDKGAEKFVQALEKNFSLLELDLSGNTNISQEWIDEIKKRLERNRALAEGKLSSASRGTPSSVNPATTPFGLMPAPTATPTSSVSSTETHEEKLFSSPGPG